MPQGDRSEKGYPLGSQAAGLGSRYEVYGEIASGGMASVQYGRLLGPRGFSRAVAIKRLHAHFNNAPDFVSMFLDEARLSAQLVHANIVHTIDMIETPGEVALVMEYVHGESLWALMRLTRQSGHLIPVHIACALIASVLHGLHAAHEARADDGTPLHIVHRDVSPQNILIGSDGVPRVLDFGIAKALGRIRTTPSGEIKGKLGYIASEQLRSEPVDRRTDVYGAGVVLWEALTGVPLFDGTSESAIVHRVLYDVIQAPSSSRPEVSAALDAIVLRALQRQPSARYANAHDMALQLERAIGLASQREIAAWLQETASERLAERAKQIAALQDDSAVRARREVRGTLSGTRRIAPPTAASPVAPDNRTVDLDEHTDAFELTTNTFVAADASLLAPVVSLVEAPPPRGVMARARWVVGLAAVLGLCAWLVQAWQSRNVEERSQPTAAATRVAVTAEAAPPPAVAEVKPELPAALPSVVSRVAGHTRSGSARAASRVLVPRAALHMPPVEAAAAPPKRCALHYELDAKGIRRLKPECL
ncbi:MAG: hypothetical protein RL701_1097 [Pseudomonadota bacterium]